MKHKLVSSYKYNIELKALSIKISNNMIAIRKTYRYYQCSTYWVMILLTFVSKLILHHNKYY